MNSKDFRKKDGDFILQLTSICIQRLQKWWNDLSLKQFYYTRDHRLNIIHPRVQILIYLVITFSTSTSSFHLTFLGWRFLEVFRTKHVKKGMELLNATSKKRFHNFIHTPFQFSNSNGQAERQLETAPNSNERLEYRPNVTEISQDAFFD